VTSKRERSLDATKSRPVQLSVAESERAAILAYCERTGESISAVIRTAAERASSVTGEPVEAARAWVSARLEPEQIDDVTSAAQAAGIEPTTWLRHVVLAYVGASSGDVLARQLDAVRQVSPAKRQRRKRNG
jgi:hypothetical protein